MMILGSERVVTNDFSSHKTAEDYSGNHLSEIKITGSAKVVRVVNHYLPHEDSLNYDSFVKNQYQWKDGDYYNCISITGKSIRYHKDELGGNCVVLSGYVDGVHYYYGLYHMAKVNVNVGDIVNQDTILGYQGNTGLVASRKALSDVTYGTHVHMELIDDSNNYLNPRDYALGNKRIEWVSQGNERNENMDQIHILADKINIRESFSKTSKDLGDVYKDETYDILEVKDNEGYTWYKIKTSTNITGYVANLVNENWIEVLKKKEQEQEEKEDEQEESNLDSKYILLYKAEKTDIYYIRLKENEELYLKK